MRRRPRRGAGACGAIDPKRGGFGCAIAVTVTSFLPKLGMERLGPRPNMNTKGRKHWTKSWSIGMSFARRAPSWAPLSCGFSAIFAKTAPNRSPRSQRSEEHTSELQSLMRHSYAVFCLKQKNIEDL